MADKYTDADVARMLGWPVGATEHYIDNRATNMIAFGLSTPPSPEADANAARWVKPWLKSTLEEFQEEVFYKLRDQHKKLYDEHDPENQYINLVWWLAFIADGPTLCRACLMVGDGK